MLKIDLLEIPVRDIVDSYVDSGISGVTGFHGKLNIRPAYQREFVYKESQRNAVIDTIWKGFPLNIMYWVQTKGDNHDDPDAEFEILDGQQRTISFCQFCANEFMMILNGNLKTFLSLSEDEKNKILDYKCMIYICKGSHSEKLEWFRVINTAGEKLYEQELRNATYPGKWLTSAKAQFSKPGCAAYSLGGKLLTGSPIRQDYLETALDWIRQSEGMNSIEEYMLTHQSDPNSIPLWNYYSNVINWVNGLFSTYRSQMKGVPWGILYNKYHLNIYDPVVLERKVAELMNDDEVESKKGIYSYVFDELEKNLNLRSFSDAQKIKTYNKQGGLCPRCKSENKPSKTRVWNIDEMEADHITPWHLGGKTTDENCQMLCKTCNREKGGH